MGRPAVLTVKGPNSPSVIVALEAINAPVFVTLKGADVGVLFPAQKNILLVPGDIPTLVVLLPAIKLV